MLLLHMVHIATYLIVHALDLGSLSTWCKLSTLYDNNCTGGNKVYQASLSVAVAVEKQQRFFVDNLANARCTTYRRFD